MGLTLTTAPTVEPLTTAGAKSHLAVTSSDDDSLIDAYVSSARETLEQRTRRAFLTQTYTYTRRTFGAVRILLPRPALQSVTPGKYYPDGGGAQTTPVAGTGYRVATSVTSGAGGLAGGNTGPGRGERHDRGRIAESAGAGTRCYRSTCRARRAP